jgi:hypothetical protein
METLEILKTFLHSEYRQHILKVRNTGPLKNVDRSESDCRQANVLEALPSFEKRFRLKSFGLGQRLVFAIVMVTFVVPVMVGTVHRLVIAGVAATFLVSITVCKA